MRHLSGVAFVYQHPEMCEEGLMKEYAKIEPFVSLDFKAVAEGESESRDRELVRLVRELQQKVAGLQVSQVAPLHSDVIILAQAVSSNKTRVTVSYFRREGCGSEDFPAF